MRDASRTVAALAVVCSRTVAALQMIKTVARQAWFVSRQHTTSIVHSAVRNIE